MCVPFLFFKRVFILIFFCLYYRKQPVVLGQRGTVAQLSNAVATLEPLNSPAQASTSKVITSQIQRGDQHLRIGKVPGPDKINESVYEDHENFGSETGSKTDSETGSVTGNDYGDYGDYGELEFGEDGEDGDSADDNGNFGNFDSTNTVKYVQENFETDNNNNSFELENDSDGKLFSLLYWDYIS